MTLNRRGDAFKHFFEALFLKMKSGTTMPAAWVELQPQTPELDRTDFPVCSFSDFWTKC
jgi:hypothetical protein